MNRGGAAVSSVGSQRNRGPWRQDGGGGVSLGPAATATALLAASVLGTLRLFEEIKGSWLGRDMGMLWSKLTLTLRLEGFLCFFCR